MIILLEISLFFLKYQSLINDRQVFLSAPNSSLSAGVKCLTDSVLLNKHLFSGTQNLFGNSRALDDVKIANGCFHLLHTGTHSR